MTIIGTVESVWRYPVKSMRGEELASAFLGFAGVYGDRWFAFCSSAARAGFPFFTGREQEQMLRYRAVYRHPERMAAPPNLAEAEALAPGATPVYTTQEDACVDVETPAGDIFAIDDPLLIAHLREGVRDRHELSLIRGERSMTDCRPISLFSLQTVRQLGEEIGAIADKRRFRANLYLNLPSAEPFSENAFTGRTLQIGDKARIAVTDRDPRCKMITLDPDTAQANPDVLRAVARAHGGTAGVYGSVIVQGTVWPGDEVSVVD